jgi:hypothetical protein
MNEQVVFALLFELWRDIREPAFLWQVLALGMSLLLAWGLSRYGRQQEFVRSTAEHGALRTFSTGSIKRVAFPLLSLLLILIVRKLFKYWHLGPVSLFDPGGAPAAVDGAGAGGDLCAAARPDCGELAGDFRTLRGHQYLALSGTVSDRACGPADRDARTGELPCR